MLFLLQRLRLGRINSHNPFFFFFLTTLLSAMICGGELVVREGRLLCSSIVSGTEPSLNRWASMVWFLRHRHQLHPDMRSVFIRHLSKRTQHPAHAFAVLLQNPMFFNESLVIKCVPWLFCHKSTRADKITCIICRGTYPSLVPSISRSPPSLFPPSVRLILFPILFLILPLKMSLP